jgi:hypothetical protein
MPTEANSLNAATTGIVGNTGTSFTATAATQYNVIVGGSTSSTLSNVAPSATSGIPLISQGNAANPAFGTAVVAGGGTGAVTLTGILIGNGTSAVTANAVTQHDVLVGGSSNAITSVAPSATSGVPFISQGASLDPAFGTAVVAGGGTGAVTFTAYAPICGGTTATGAFQSASTGFSSSGNVLASNGSAALPSFQALSGLAVTSITGTADQVAASASTGAVTLSIPTTVAIGTSNTAATGAQITLNATSAFNTVLAGTQTAQSGNNEYGLYVNSTLAPSANLSGTAAALAVNVVFNPANSTTASNVAGLYVGANSQGAAGGTVTNSYGVYSTNPGFGSNPCAIYGDNLSIGYTGTAPPTNGIIVSGQSAIGASSVGSYPQLTVSTTNAVGEIIQGTQTAVNGSSNQFGIISNSTFAPTSGSTTSAAVSANPVFAVPNAQTTTSAVGLFSQLGYTGNVGTITKAYGLFVTSGGAGAGTITTSYGAYIQTQTAGSTQIALYADNLSVGYSSAAAPTNGAIIEGRVGIGISSPDSVSSLAINTTNAVGTFINGTQAAVNGSSNQFTYQANTTLAPTSGSGVSACFAAVPVWGIPSTQTTTTAAGVYVSMGFASNVGTITTAYGILVLAGNNSAGTVTNTYGGYFTEPSLGTNRCALYADNLAVGVAASGTPTAGTIKSAPPSSSSATTSFGTSLTAGTAAQNTNGYDILVNIVVVVASATGATIKLGVSSSSTPTTSTAVPSFSSAGTFSLSAYVPTSYYLLVATTGTISVTSITTVAMAI